MKKEDIDYSVYLVTDRRNKTDEEFLNIIEEAIKGGTTIVQLREKTASTKEFYDLAFQDDMPADIAREIIGDDKILGVSASTVEEAKKAEKDSADYIGSGAVFPTATKDDADSVSQEELKEIVDSIDIPVVAIGGITVENAHTLKGSGIAGFSVVSAIMSAEDPKEASEKLKEIYFS